MFAEVQFQSWANQAGVLAGYLGELQSRWKTLFFFCMSIPFPLPTFVNSAYSDFHAMDVVLGCDNLQCMSVDKPKTNKGNSGCRRREFSSLNFHFLKSLPEQVVMAMEFDCIEKQTLVTRELICMVRRCSESGGSSFAHFQRQITDFHFDNFIRMKTDYLHRFNVWKSGVTALILPSCEFQNLLVKWNNARGSISAQFTQRHYVIFILLIFKNVRNISMEQW